MDIITGYTGVKHITAEQDRDINIGIFGVDSCVLSTGLMMEAEISSNTEIKIRDGVLMHQGCAASIKKNTYDSCVIANGSQGMKRIDLIVARYEKNADTGVESLDFVVLQGTPVESNPVAPAYIEGDIQAGDYVADMPMYEVVIDGPSISQVNKLFKVHSDEAVDSIIEQSTNGTNTYRKWASGVSEYWGVVSANIPIDVWSAWGSVYYVSRAMSALGGSYPEGLFVDNQIIHNLSIASVNGECWGVVSQNTANKNVPPSLYLYTAQKPTKVISIGIGIYSKGRWK